MNTGLRIGAHFSPGGKHLLGALAAALDAPASAIQLFGGIPERYWCSHVSDEDRETFRAATENLYVIVHSPYIINLGENPNGPRSRNWLMSQHSIVNNLHWADSVGASAMVFHTGSAKDEQMDDAMEWVEDGLQKALARYVPGQPSEYPFAPTLDGGVHLCLENDAGDPRGRKIGQDLDRLSELVRRVSDPRLRVVIDTTHAFAAGYTVDQIIEWVSLHDDIVEAIHFNTPDAVVTCGSFKDRHSVSFLDGAFSFDELIRLFLAFRHKPMILEGTPNLADDLVWMLKWELELKKSGKIEAPKFMKSHHLGDIFELTD